MRGARALAVIGAVLSLCISSMSSVSALSGQCPRVGATRTVRGERFECRRVIGTMKWSKIVQNSRGSSMLPTAPKPVLPVVVFRTLTNATRNTSFQIALQEMPEIAQSITLESALAFDKIAMSIFGVNTVKPQFFTVPFSEKSKYEESKFEFESFDASVAVTVLRAVTSDVLIPTHDIVDVSTGFESVYSESVKVTVSKNQAIGSSAPMNLEIPLSRTVDLVSGSYLLVFGFEWQRFDILTIRLWGQESGTNTAGGKGGDQVKICAYTPTPDAYPQGRAFSGLGLRRWNGDPSSSIGFGSRFRPATAKVTACIVKGEWGNDIFNPGDLDVALVRGK